MKLRQQGFGIIGVMIVLLVIVGISGAGYVVYNTKADSSDPEPAVLTPVKSDTTAQESTNTPAATDQITSKTLTVGDASGWTVSTKTSEVNACGDGKTYEKLVLNKAETKTITIVSNNCGQGLSSDAEMSFKAAGSIIQVANKQLKLCTKDQNAFCTAGDNKTTLSGMVSQTESAKNTYLVTLTNSSAEDISESALKEYYQVVESITLL